MIPVPGRSYEKVTFRSFVARTSFVIYMFFVFFGTSMPFRDKIDDISDVGSSNPVNQIVFSLLFMTSFLAILASRDELKKLLKKEKFLPAFILWCLLSIAWSDFKWVSFKRLFQVSTTISICAAFLLNIKRPRDILHYLRPILYLYLSLSMASVLLISGAMDVSSGSWRGLATSKNHFGQACLIGIIFLFSSIRYAVPKRFWLDTMMMILALIMLFGSQSMTAMVTFMVIVLLAVVLRIDGHFKSHGFANLFLIFIAPITVLGFLYIHLLHPGLISNIFECLGKDPTFTGRTDLWNVILAEVEKHPVIGAGFQGFWVINNPELIKLYERFVWIPLQAHMGYLDLLNETGMIGLSIFVFMVLNYFRIYFTQGSSWTQYFLVAVLILNLQESTLFRPNIITGVFFILAYLTMQTVAAGLMPRGSNPIITTKVNLKV